MCHLDFSWPKVIWMLNRFVVVDHWATIRIFILSDYL